MPSLTPGGVRLLDRVMLLGRRLGVGLNPDKRQRCGQRAERAWLLCWAPLRRAAWVAAHPAG